MGIHELDTTESFGTCTIYQELRIQSSEYYLVDCMGCIHNLFGNNNIDPGISPKLFSKCIGNACYQYCFFPVVCEKFVWQVSSLLLI